MDEVEIGVMGQAGAQEIDEVGVGFDRDDEGSLGGEAFGQRAGAGADFKHQVVRSQLGGVHDAREVGFVEEEVLSQALARGKAGGAQRLQPIRHGSTPQIGITRPVRQHPADLVRRRRGPQQIDVGPPVP